MSRTLGSPQIRKAYAFLSAREKLGQPFSVSELSIASGWTPNTTRRNITMKLSGVLTQKGQAFSVHGVCDKSEDTFCRLCSQKSSLLQDLHLPRLAPTVQESVVKAKEAALSAVQVYNNPTAMFRSANFIVLMIIAYTSLFHAIFKRDAVDYREYKSPGQPRTVNGQVCLWDVLKSVAFYITNYGQKYRKGMCPAMVANLTAMAELRNMIEHRDMPIFDETVAAECQSMVMNFEALIVEEFGLYFALNASLSLPLLFSTVRSPKVVDAMRRLQSQEHRELEKFISDFRSTLPEETLGDMSYAFRVWLIQKPAKTAASSDMSIEVVKLEEIAETERDGLLQRILAIAHKNRDVMVTPSDWCKMWERQAVEKIKSAVGSEVVYGTGTKTITNAMIRDVVKAHNVDSLPKMYYRPLPDARAQFSQKFVDWVELEYAQNGQFFFDAHKLIRQGMSLPPPPED